MRSDLEYALEAYDNGYADVHEVSELASAARKWDALTSAENVEKGALAIVNMPYDSLELRNGDKSELFAETKIAESVLRAVGEDSNA